MCFSFLVIPNHRTINSKTVSKNQPDSNFILSILPVTQGVYQNWMHFISDRLYDFGNREQDVCLITCVFAYGSK